MLRLAFYIQRVDILISKICLFHADSRPECYLQNINVFYLWNTWSKNYFNSKSLAPRRFVISSFYFWNFIICYCDKKKKNDPCFSSSSLMAKETPLMAKESGVHLQKDWGHSLKQQPKEEGFLKSWVFLKNSWGFSLPLTYSCLFYYKILQNLSVNIWTFFSELHAYPLFSNVL